MESLLQKSRCLKSLIGSAQIQSELLLYDALYDVSSYWSVRFGCIEGCRTENMLIVTMAEYDRGRVSHRKSGSELLGSGSDTSQICRHSEGQRRDLGHQAIF